jgi:hypothetical protein
MSVSIAVENQKQGAPQSQWMLQPGQASSSIEGFTTSMSIDLGNTVDFKINTDSNDYRIDIYRLGYYGGDGATLVTSIEHQTASAIDQPAPLRDPVTGNIDAGNWSVTDSWDVPSDATSGVYIAKMVRLDGTEGENIIPFVVTNNAGTSDIIFQTSDQTWQAYNAWGGGSFYTDTAQNISYNRPIQTPAGPDDTTSSGPWDFVFGEELPAIYWLEQNGYDVSYQSGIDTATNGSLLLNHKAFLSVGHDEYWTAEQQNNVRAARDAGVNLNFWSGNEVYWTTELLPSIDGSGAPNRTLVTYKTTSTGLQNPDGVWTGTTRDPAGGLIPENALSGQLYLVDWDKDTPLNPITVPYQYAQLSIWKNTEVADLQPGETYTSQSDYLGYEWDVNATSNELANNGYSPPGLVALSSTTVTTDALNNGYIVTGLITGTATHNLTMYRAPSGALVFGAGSVMWSWSLSSLHTPGPDGSPTDAPADPVFQQAMVNLLAQEGIQPATLDSSLVLATQSSDFLPPTSVISTNTAAEFVAGQLATITGTATDRGGGVVAGVEVSTDGGNSWHSASLALAAASASWTYSWTPSASGSYTILARSVDDVANLEHPQLSANFAITNFYNNFAVSQGWANPDTMRKLADFNGDGRADLIGFGNSTVFGAASLGTAGQYTGGASFSTNLDALVNDFGIATGYTQANQRGVDFVGNFSNSPTDHYGTIWAVGPDGFHYAAVVDSSSATATGGATYATFTYGDFGLAQGWTKNYAVDVAFLSTSDSYASVVGFGDAGLWVGQQVFDPTATAPQHYIAAGSQTLGGASGWDSTLDIQTFRDYRGNTIDLNNDGITDFVGMGPNGLEYAYGQYTAGATPGSQVYSLGAIQKGASGTNIDFGRDQGWDTSTSERIIADINGDGRVDILAFGDAGVWASLGQQANPDGSGAFGTAYLAMGDYGTQQGWSTAVNTRVLGDIYGNGQVDIIGFGADYTFVATPTTDPTTGHVTFAMTENWHAYGTNEGYTPAQNFRGVADVTGTGIDSIVVSSATNTQILTHV